jgi:hypothetical protein
MKTRELSNKAEEKCTKGAITKIYWMGMAK